MYRGDILRFTLKQAVNNSFYHLSIEATLNGDVLIRVDVLGPEPIDIVEFHPGIFRKESCPPGNIEQAPLFDTESEQSK